MKRNFALPVALAAVFHAALLFGFRTPHLVANDKEPSRKMPSKPPPRIEVVPEPPPSEPATEEAALAKGSSETPRPELPEPPPRDDSTRPPMVPPTTKPVFTGDSPKVDLNPPGRPDGRLVGPAEGPIGAALLDNPPRARLQAAPQYPYEARRDGLTGSVSVEFTVDETGAVLDPHVVAATDRSFEEATLRAVAKWRFEPGKRAGRIVRFRMALPVVFNLGDR